ncbi:MAG TPA: hypothetical protein DCL35_05610 [Candidatus Omnitrophica bacterium]|nr:hypothetical protein [Candidatus Omnitrophota bacterium]
MIALQNNDAYIGELLLRDGAIAREDLDKGLEEQKKTRDFLCSTLVRLGFASEEKIFSILSLQIGVPFLNLQDVEIDRNVLGRIPGNFALACKFFPIKESDGALYIAMADPLNSGAVDEIKSYLGADNLKVFLASDSEIRRAIKAHYGI